MPRYFMSLNTRSRKPPVRAWQSSQISRSRLTVPEQLVSRFVQTPFGTADICREEVTDQFTRQFVDVGTFEVIDPQASKVQNARAQHPADVDAAAVEYFPVHDRPPLEAPRQRLRLLGGDSETNR